MGQAIRLNSKLETENSPASHLWLLKRFRSSDLHLTFRSKASTSSAYRADIDGLRAIAVVAVVLFHAKVPGFSGGYVGVDVFFVISGYLITRIIHGELQSGQFTFLGFYERRIRRIFPALFTVILACALAGIALLAPQQLLSLGRSMLAVTGFASNIYFASTSHAAGYFADDSVNQLLLHTWSLSLEEQFYVLFPLLLIVLHKVAKRFTGTLVLLLALVSFAAGVHTVHWHPIAAFYLLPGRAWELLAGALIVLKPLPSPRSRVIKSLLGLAGLVAIVYAITTYTEATPFPGTAALLPCLGAVLLLYTGEGDGRSWVGSAMGFGPLVFLGAISYSLYLWHWPLIVLTKYCYANGYISPIQQVPGLLAALLLAILTFELIETPFRNRSQHRTSDHPAVWVGIGASFALAAVSLALVLSNGLPQRFKASKTAHLTLNYERKSEMANVGDCFNYRRALEHYEDAVFCAAAPASKNVLFWGDSHMQQLHPLLQNMAESGQLRGEGAVFALSGSCSVGESFNVVVAGFHCDRFTQYALQRASQPDIDTVFLAFSPWWALWNGKVCVFQNGHCTRTLSHEQAWAIFLNEMEGHIRDLQRMGKRFVLTVPFPSYDTSIPDLEIRNIGLQHLVHTPMVPHQMVPAAIRNDIIALAARTGAGIYNPRETLCSGDLCTYEQNDVSIYVDESHIASSQLERLRPGLLKVLNQPGK
jgi:peptidoglycan/LPS O-acetylase OafA/YrhL